MKKIILALAIPLLVMSCSKDKDESTPYGKTITGVNFTNIDATPAGSVGVSDSKVFADSFSMHIYPTPCINQLKVDASINNTTSLTITAKLVNVTYPDAPKTLNFNGSGGTPIFIENKSLAGTVALTEVKNIDGIVGGQRVAFTFDVSALPQGFYRVYLESSDGRSLWDNTLVTK